MSDKQKIFFAWKYVLCVALGFAFGVGIGIAGAKVTHKYLSDNDPDLSSETKNGWKLEDGKWYCYEDGARQKNKWFYTGMDGSMCVDSWQNIEGKDHFFASCGAMQDDEGLVPNKDTNIDEIDVSAEDPLITGIEDYIGYFDNDEIKQTQGGSAYINIREIKDSRIYGEYYFSYSYLTEMAQFYEQGIPVNGDTFTIQEFRLYDDLDTVADPHTVTLKLTRVNGMPALEFIQYDGEEISSSYFMRKGETREGSGWSEDPVGSYDFNNGYYIGDQGEPVYGLDGNVTMEITKVDDNRVYGIFDLRVSDVIVYEDFREYGVSVDKGTFYVRGYKFQFVHDFERTEDILLGFDTGLKWMIPKAAEKDERGGLSPSEVKAEDLYEKDEVAQEASTSAPKTLPSAPAVDYSGYAGEYTLEDNHDLLSGSSLWLVITEIQDGKVWANAQAGAGSASGEAYGEVAGAEIIDGKFTIVMGDIMCPLGEETVQPYNIDFAFSSDDTIESRANGCIYTILNGYQGKLLRVTGN